MTPPPRFVVFATAAAVAFAFPLVAQDSSAAACASLPSRTAPKLPAVIPVEIQNNHVLVPVCRGSTPLTFTLDTGAPFSIFDLTLAQQLGVAIESQYRANGGGPGTAAAARTREDSVIIPGAMIKVPITNAIDFAPLAASGRHLQGILGADFLSRYVVGIDYVNRQMRLYDRASFAYDGRGTVVPFQLRGAFIYVNGDVILDDGAKLPGTFVVDVGSSQSLSLARPFVEENRLRERVGTTVRRPGGRGVGGVSMADVGRVAEFRIGRVSIPRPIVNLYGEGSGVFATRALGDGNVGADLLRRFTVFFDYAARQMILEPHGATNEPFEADMSGLSLAAGPNATGFTVDFVVARSPAGDAGFAPGDTVVAVDGDANVKLEALRRRLRRENETVTFTIRRNGVSKALTIVTRRLV